MAECDLSVMMLNCRFSHYEGKMRRGKTDNYNRDSMNWHISANYRKLTELHDANVRYTWEITEL